MKASILLHIKPRPHEIEQQIISVNTLGTDHLFSGPGLGVKLGVFSVVRLGHLGVKLKF